MPPVFKTSFLFPHFEVVIHANHKATFDLICRSLSSQTQAERRHAFGKPKLTVNMFYYKTPYSQIPRSRYDCFHGFTLFYNRFAEYEYDNQPYHKSRVIYDVGPRTLRTVIDLKKNSITSYIAAPPDIEKDLLFDLIYFQPLKYLLQVRGLHLFHASCVLWHGKGVLFCGKSGSGKSTLALALLRKGFQFFSDDEVVLQRRGGKVKCASFPSMLKIPDASLRAFPEMNNLVMKRRYVNEKKVVDVARQFPVGKDKTVRPCLLIFPRFVNSAKTRIEPLDKQRALARLAREEFSHIRYSGPRVYQNHFLILASLLRCVKTYKLFYRNQDLDKIPDLIKQLEK